ncbi:MAG: hypothetical protein RSC91_06540, partial [Clostridia bacterium]
SLYIVGLLDVLLLSAVSLAASLYFKNTVNARYLVGMIGIGIVVGKIVTGFSTIVSDRTRMSTLQNLFDTDESVYLITLGVLVVICVLVCIIRGSQLARVYNPPLLKELPALTQQRHGTVVLKRFDQNRTKKHTSTKYIEASVDEIKQKAPFSLPAFMTTVLLIISIVIMLGVNVLVLACGYASPERETSIFGTIPYVFQSSTMEPTIMMNDLAFFHKLDYQEELQVNDIALYKDVTGEVKVARIKKYVTENAEDPANSTMLVDIDSYIDARYKGMAEQTIARSQIYGKFTSADRWLGALILFANTTLGRLLLLLIPTFLVFFYDPITKFFRSITVEHDTSHLPQAPTSV